MLTKFKSFFKAEAVLCISALCALLTMFLVPPDAEYPGYIDWKVLCLLLCLMAVVAGFQACGAFRWLTARMLRRGGSGKTLGVMLVWLPFFSAMVVTNDVALLVFVPFTLGLLSEAGCSRHAVPILVLQTVAANLGSMATPVGNPQNLYLYAAFDLGAGEFFAVMLPLTAVSLVALTIAAMPVLPKTVETPAMAEEKLAGGKLAAYGVLFAVCLLTVFRVLHFGIMTVIVLAGIAVLDRQLLKKLDIALLATFVCFFIVSGNLGRMEAVRAFLQGLLESNTLLTAVGTSQIISNVPAAVLLSGFTDQWQSLLEGVNIGGLGTPIASLASLITLKLYLRHPGARAGEFLATFTAANVLGLAVLLAAAMIF
ncbi:MAG: citrate transporter [Oscillospiraceae bacterium]|nr:citrate transporter [Oscillospiraceae bacterium]